jgi:cardiolipin synthase
VGVRIDGPAVAVLGELFRESWRDEGGCVPDDRASSLPAAPASGDAGVLVVSGGPHHNRSFIRSAFRMAMAGAAESIRIINPYFIPGPRVIRSLLRAAARGVRVQLILPARTDVRLVQLVSRSSYAPLLKAGIEIYERQGTVLHAKVMLIDCCWAVIGSANLDHRSFHRNYEVNVVVDSQEFGDQVAAIFADDLAQSRRVDLDEHERRGLVARALERLFSLISWFL